MAPGTQRPLQGQREQGKAGRSVPYPSFSTLIVIVKALQSSDGLQGVAGKGGWIQFGVLEYRRVSKNSNLMLVMCRAVWVRVRCGSPQLGKVSSLHGRDAADLCSSGQDRAELKSVTELSL